MRAFIARFLNDQRAATAVEYGLLLVLLALVIIAGATTAFNAIGVKFNVIANTLH